MKNDPRQRNDKIRQGHHHVPIHVRKLCWSIDHWDNYTGNGTEHERRKCGLTIGREPERTFSNSPSHYVYRLSRVGEFLMVLARNRREGNDLFHVMSTYKQQLPLGQPVSSIQQTNWKGQIGTCWTTT